MIEVICEVEDGWWRGKLNGKTGLFSSNFVELVDEKDVTQGKDKHDEMQSKCFVVNVFDTVNMSWVIWINPFTAKFSQE